MTEPDEPTLDDVLPVEEQAVRDRHEHAKTPKHVNEEHLERRTEQERIQAGVDDYDENEVPPADA